MVSNASEDLPDPETPVTTVNALCGISTSMFLRLWVRAPRTTMLPLPSGAGMGAGSPLFSTSEVAIGTNPVRGATGWLSAAGQSFYYKGPSALGRVVVMTGTELGCVILRGAVLQVDRR